MKIAVTGSIGSGKSTVSKMLAAALRGRYLDTDILCRDLLQPGAEGYRQFVGHYGRRFISRDGSVDRQLLRQAVFDERSVKEDLENILHPLVKKMVDEAGMACRAAGTMVVVEVPLLYEVGWQHEFDSHLLVYVPEQLLYSRVATRDGLTREMVTKILSAQMSLEEKAALADCVIDNSGLFVSTVQQTGWYGRQLHGAAVGNKQRSLFAGHRGDSPGMWISACRQKAANETGP